MTTQAEPLLIALDVVAIAVLVFGLYMPRYQRREMVVALLGVNIGVLAVASTLSSSNLAVGVGLGLFGVLSIIRLRSVELDQEDVAYYFASLSLGLLGGIAVDPLWSGAALMGAVVAVLAVGDHPALFRRRQRRVVTLDRAFTDDAELQQHLAELLGGDVGWMRVRQIDLVRDLTVVDVRYTSRET